MSIASTLANAASGLAAATRTAELISSNVANANTDGYGRRDIRLGSVVNGTSGAGVRVIGIDRNVDQIAINDRRLADASLGNSSTSSFYFDGLQDAFGTPETQGSLSARLSSLESALVQAAGAPQSSENLQSVFNAARDVTGKINSVAATIQDARQSADQQIANQVSTVNNALLRIKDLNEEIAQRTNTGGDFATLMDQRQQQIDQITSIIPVRELPRDDGKIALITENGSILLDDNAAEIEFRSTLTITPDMTLEAGSLSGLTITGAGSAFGDGLAMISGGSLSALFDVRDTLAVNSQAQLDAFSRDLVERFADPALDTTLTAGDPGLFTDRGAALDPLDEVGLSNRLSLNALVDPDQGGTVTRLRDGLGAVTPGPVGENGLLQAMSDRLARSQEPVSGNFLRSGSSASLVSELLSEIGLSRTNAMAEQSFAAAQVAEFKEAELRAGVNTDQELQRLLLVEKAFAANAKVITTVDEMLDTLLRI